MGGGQSQHATRPAPAPTHLHRLPEGAPLKTRPCPASAQAREVCPSLSWTSPWPPRVSPVGLDCVPFPTRGLERPQTAGPYLIGTGVLPHRAAQESRKELYPRGHKQDISGGGVPPRGVPLPWASGGPLDWDCGSCSSPGRVLRCGLCCAPAPAGREEGSVRGATEGWWRRFGVIAECGER